MKKLDIQLIVPEFVQLEDISQILSIGGRDYRKYNSEKRVQSCVNNVTLVKDSNMIILEEGE